MADDGGLYAKETIDEITAELERELLTFEPIGDPARAIAGFEDFFEAEFAQPVIGRLDGDTAILGWTIAMNRFPDHESLRCISRPRVFSSVRVV
jgi:hypothetical protein